MRQSQLTRESQKCDHGLYFGTTCEKCEADELRIALRAILDIFENRERFVMMGPRAFAQCEQIARSALERARGEFT